MKNLEDPTVNLDTVIPASRKAALIELALIDLNVRPDEEVEPCLPGLFCLGGNDRSLDRLHLVDAVSEMTLWPARARQVDLPLRCLCVRFRQMPWRCGKNETQIFTD